MKPTSVMLENSNAAPLVFISYSHDSEDHKTWVRNLAESLCKLEIDVILDQWEIGPGDDVPKFMEQSVRKSHRVIMVCSEPYVRKVDDGKGGAGYEAMAVTGELVHDLGTRKFIPIVRQSTDEPQLPSCVSTRYYVDFSKEESFSEKLEELARNIHSAPKFEKPALGKNPFTDHISSAGIVASPETMAADVFSVYEIYRKSLTLADAEDFAAWRELIHVKKNLAEFSLLNWKAENEKNFPVKASDLPSYFLPSLKSYEGVFAVAFGALDSANEKFHNQLSLLDWIRNPKGWEKSGPIVWTNLPELVLFTYQALLGGLALSRQRPELAYELATTTLRSHYSSGVSHPLYRYSNLVGWPESLNHTCTLAQKFLQEIAKEWEWLWKLFGSEEDAMASISAYYLFLNTIDFVSAVKSRSPSDTVLRDLNAPIFVNDFSRDSVVRIQSIYYGSIEYIGEILVENGVNIANLSNNWNLWIQNCRKWLNAVHNDYGFHSDVEIPHQDLPQRLLLGNKRRLID